MVDTQSDSTPPGSLPLALIVGDAPRGTGWLRHLLEANGYGALTLTAGREALAVARGAIVDVIAIDTQLTDMDGVTLCRLLRTDVRVSAATPVLLVSPEPLPGADRLEGLRAGAWDCVDPAISPEDLLLRVQAFVRARREAEQQRGAGLVDPASGLYNRQGLARRVREIGSQAYRERSALACVALGIEVPSGPQAELVIRRCTEALKTSARVSDVVGRLAVQEFAVVAPSTGPKGAVQLAQRLARSLDTAAAHAWRGAPAVRFRAGYESVANVGYEPMEPMELLARATAALRTGRPEPGLDWLRRYEAGGSATV